MRQKFLVGALLLALGAGLVACTPTFNWREVRPTGDLAALFPCKPDVTPRTLRLARADVAARMWSCSTGGMTFAVLHADMGNPALLAPAVAELKAGAVANLGGRSVSESGWAGLNGVLPTQRLVLAGQRPDGLEIDACVILFAKGLHVYQATVNGSALDEAAADAFFSGLVLTE